MHNLVIEQDSKASKSKQGWIYLCSAVTAGFLQTKMKQQTYYTKSLFAGFESIVNTTARNVCHTKNFRISDIESVVLLAFVFCLLHQHLRFFASTLYTFFLCFHEQEKVFLFQRLQWPLCRELNLFFVLRKVANRLRTVIECVEELSSLPSPSQNEMN